MNWNWKATDGKKTQLTSDAADKIACEARRLGEWEKADGYSEAAAYLDKLLARDPAAGMRFAAKLRRDPEIAKLLGC